MAIQLNEEGLKQAKELIRAHKYDWSTDWNPPTMAAQEAFIRANAPNGVKAYSRWALGYDKAKKDTDAKYPYLYGDFTKLYVSALLDIEDKILAESTTDKGSCAILAAIQELRDLIYADLMNGAQKVYKQMKNNIFKDEDDCNCC